MNDRPYRLFQAAMVADTELRAVGGDDREQIVALRDRLRRTVVAEGVQS